MPGVVVWLRGLGFRDLALLSAACLAMVWTTASFAQEAAPAAPAAAAPAAAPAAPAATPAPASAPKQEQSFLGWVIGAMGVFFFPQLALGIAIFALIGVNFLGGTRSRFINQPFIDQFDAMVKNRQYKEAFEAAKVENNFLGKILTSGLSRLTDGYAEAVTAVQDSASVENMKNEHRLSVLSMMANIATLVGLLGTVWGMVASFMVLARSDVAPPPSELAKGVSQALVTTVVGLLEAIPAIIAFTFISNLNSKRLVEVGVAADNLMRPFKQVSVGRPKPAGPTPAAAPSPSPAPAVASAAPPAG